MVINAMQGDLEVTPLISHTPVLSEGPLTFAKMADREIWYNKVVFTISEEAQQESDMLFKN